MAGMYPLEAGGVVADGALLQAERLDDRLRAEVLPQEARGVRQPLPSLQAGARGRRLEVAPGDAVPPGM